jgi:hypothetical protein
MQRYMQALAEQSARPSQQQQMQQGDTKTITQNDIQTLMQAIQQLSQAGDREGAAQMMALAAEPCWKICTCRKAPAAAAASPQNKALNDAIQKFGDMMGKERSLLDKTMRQKSGPGDPKDGGAQGLAEAAERPGKRTAGFAQGHGRQVGEKLREAGKAMGDAQPGAGPQRTWTNAGSAQNQALDALRQGAQELADEADKNGQQPGGKEDPLGRSGPPLGNTGIKIPGQADLARAREILEELRRRAGQMNRPQQERDYLDRLLKHPRFAVALLKERSVARDHFA